MPKNPLSSVDSIRHKEKRTNIPTEELRDFVKEDESSPKTLLYPRDPSLDPQLVWKGKDEQDKNPLEVPAVPIYIQEKIHPHALIEDMERVKAKAAPTQMELFADFNGIEDFEKKVDFYSHDAGSFTKWSNRLVLGDSLLVMASLAEKENLKGKVQMIYMDPPYGIKFGSNWQVSTRKRDVKDGKAEDLTRQPEQIRAFRDTWELGIHSYLSYLRDRFTVARELLTESGSLFVQMNSENAHLVRCVMDEVFGSENFIADIVFRKKNLPLGSTHLETMHDHVIFYAKEKNNLKFKHTYEQGGVELISGHGPYALYPDNTNDKIDEVNFKSQAHPIGTKYFCLFALLAPSYSSNAVYKYEFEGRILNPPNNGSWVVSSEKLDRLKIASRLQIEGKNLRYRLIYTDFPYKKATNIWIDTQAAFKKSYVVQTSTKIIERCILMATDPGDIVLDPTCGSGTTAYVAEQWGRRWITCDTSRVSLALARTRLMAAKYPYYLLADSPEGLEKEAGLSGAPPPAFKTGGDIKKGFVYKKVPHVTLKAIANNAEIDIIYERWQKRLEPLREQINKALGKNFEEWEIPREPGKDWPKEAVDLVTEWWGLRRKRQEEMDASIARNADTETLFDQPYEDKKKIRVTGPFTVESLSPHRMLSPADEDANGTVSQQEAMQHQDFVGMILDNLRKAGVQNTIKNERLKFERLESFAGIFVHAEGEYAEKDGKIRRVAVSIGPEHGTVGPDFIKEAAKEAVKGVGFDILIVCGFAFDGHVSEEAKRYGQLIVLPCRMNMDLAMGEALLKKTGAGNLFMVFGEPDIVIAKNEDNNLTVEIRGLDIYDPTTGEIRSSATDEIACWFIDTAYNEESFFVRQAYFTGKDKPYEKLKKALRAEIDENAWEALYSNKSRPFTRPETGKIAVKVINHYGDEVLKVYGV